MSVVANSVPSQHKPQAPQSACADPSASAVTSLLWFGYTGIQCLFLSFGQIWRSKSRDGAIRQQILSNPHSPAEFRAIGPTRNIDEWYTAFNVKPGDKEYLPLELRVRLW